MFSKKMQAIKPSVVQSLSTKAKEMKAKGHDVLNLTVGEPTWECFETSQKAAIESIKKGCSSYSPAAGQKKLRETIAEETNKHLKLDYNSQNVMVSIGAKYACFLAMQTVIDGTEDEVLIPAPYWVSYPSMVHLSGGKAVVVETDESTHKLTASVLKKYLNKKTKMLILNSPNNPTGAVYSLKELKEIGECLKDFPQTLVLSDDIYNRMVIDAPAGAYAPHILEACPYLKDRVIVVNAASKNYAMPGWRLGWAVASTEWIQNMAKYQSHTVSSAPTIAQMMMVPTFQNCEGDIKRVHGLLKEKREKMSQILKGIFEFQAPEGAIYLWLNIKNLYGKTFKTKKIGSSIDVGQLLSEHHHIYTAPGEGFGRPGYLRLYFALADEDIQKFSSRIKQFISEIKQ